MKSEEDRSFHLQQSITRDILTRLCLPPRSASILLTCRSLHNTSSLHPNSLTLIDLPNISFLIARLHRSLKYHHQSSHPYSPNFSHRLLREMSQLPIFFLSALLSFLVLVWGHPIQGNDGISVNVLPTLDVGSAHADFLRFIKEQNRVLQTLGSLLKNVRQPTLIR